MFRTQPPMTRGMLLLPRLRLRESFLAAMVLCGSGAAQAASTVTALSTSSSSAAAGTAITLTATVTSAGSAVTPGTVSFCDGAYTRCMDSGLLGRAQLNASGVAKWKFVPAIGSRSFKAIFTAKTGFTASTSSSVSVSITGTRASTSTLTSSGSAGNYALTLTTSTVSNNTAAPTGTITFQDTTNGNYSLGTANLGAGTTTPGFGAVSGVSVSGTYARQSSTGDFNGDGIPDLAVPNQSNSVSILLGSSSGTFAHASGSPMSVSGTNVHTAVGDFNNDGKLDVLVCVYGGSVVLLTGNGDGTFNNAGSTSVIQYLSFLAVGDFNNDGNLDFAVVSQGWNNTRIYLGSGSGSFTYAGTEYSTGSGPYSIAVADYNGDGNLDLAVGNNGASSVAILLGSGNGSFTAASGSPLSAGTNVWSTVTADLNNDGKADLITGDNGDSNIGVFLGNGNGTFGAMTTYALAAGLKTVVAADFDGDGYVDVATCNSSTSTIVVLPGSSTGALGTARTSSFGGTGCQGLIAGDWNGDGLPDLQGVTGAYSGVMLNAQTQSATATLSGVSIPGNGSHNVQGVYPGDSVSAAGSSNSLALTATPITTTTTISASPNSVQWGQQVALSAWVSPYAVGGLAPSGSFTFYNGGSALGSNGVVGAYGQRNTTSLPMGTNSLTVTYNGDSNFNSSTSPATTVTVTQATGTVSVTSSNTGPAYGTSITLTATLPSAATGTVTFTDGGTSIGTGTASGGTATLTLNTLGVGSHTIGASYGGDVHYTSVTASTITVTVAKAAVTLLGSASRNPSLYGDVVTFSFQCIGGGATPTGQLVLKDNGTALTTLTLDGSGSASYATSALVAGSHPLTATYGGDSRYY